LRNRLRIASLITLGPMVFFLVKRFFDPNPPVPLSPLVGPFHLLVVVANVVVAGLLWSRMCLGPRSIRAMELTLFGLTAAFFGLLQFDEFYRIDAYNIHDDLCEHCAGQNIQYLDMLAKASGLRWFFLIVIYGVFIPNTWRRCATMVSCVALIPIALSAAGALFNGHLMHEGVASALSIIAVLMVSGVAIAVFGSYRLHLLQQQAFEAEQLGQYRLKKRLGAGGMGEVYLAEHLMLRRPCAVKLIRPEQAGDPTTLQRFEREVRAMAALTHWNTAEVFDYGHTESGTFYYVMEYLPGHNLERLVEQHGPVPPGRAVHILRQVCRALREAHGVGLLHRDVKPSNVIICRRGGEYDVAKLLDFGLVQESKLGQSVDRLTMVGTVLGSPQYMSPEQAAGKNDLGPASDIYGVGSVAYFLLTGKPPFVRDTIMQLFLAHAYESVVPPSQLHPDVPADLEALVLRCLSKKPEERFPDADSLEKALALCSCAFEWTEENAATWWTQPSHQAETAEYAITTLPTQVTNV
jgi:serine/threonine-protein kinase